MPWQDTFECVNQSLFCNLPKTGRTHRSSFIVTGCVSLRLDTLQTRWQVAEGLRDDTLSVVTILWRASRLAKFKYAHSQCDTMWELCSNVLLLRMVSDLETGDMIWASRPHLASGFGHTTGILDPGVCVLYSQSVSKVKAIQHWFILPLLPSERSNIWCRCYLAPGILNIPHSYVSTRTTALLSRSLPMCLD